MIFTRCKIIGDDISASLLGPLAVAPAFHGQGIGSELVRAGIKELETMGVSRLFVLGDPAFYGRFGFRPDTHVETPFPLPPEWDTAWQSLGLGDATPHSGKLSVSPQWNQPSLWAP